MRTVPGLLLTGLAFLSLPVVPLRAQQVEAAEQAFLAAAATNDMAGLLEMASGGRSFRPDRRLNDGDTPLGVAAKLGEVQLVQRLLAGRADPNLADAQGWPPLAWAVLADRPELARVLIAAGASTTAGIPGGLTVATLAVSAGSTGMLRAMGIADPRDDGPASKLMAAVMANDAAAVAAAVEAGASVNDRDPDGVTMLLAAVAGGRRTAAQKLIELRADPNQAGPQGVTPLIAAARGGHIPLVELLLQAGADVLAETEHKVSVLDAAQASGIKDLILMVQVAILGKQPPRSTGFLAAAVQSGDEAAVRRLIEAGAYVNGGTARPARLPLNLAAFAGHEGVVRALLSGGADPNTRDSRGVSPVLAATLGRREEVIRILLERGADSGLADTEGVTPMTVAMANGLTNLTRLLRAPDAGITVAEMQFAVQHGDVETVRRHHGKARRAPSPVPGTPARATVQGLTLLAIAAGTGNRAMVQALLDLGENPDGISGQQVSPLAAAALGGKDQVVQALLAAGANPFELNGSGQTPRDLARSRNHQPTAGILQTAERAKALQLSQSLRSFGYNIPVTNVWDDDKQRALERFRREYRGYEELLLADWINRADRNVLRVCNAGAGEVWTAVAERDPGSREALLSGYWSVPSGECRPVPVRLRTQGTLYYLHAERGGRTLVMPSAGDPKFCLASETMSGVVRAVSTNPTCPRQNNGRAAPFVPVPLGGNTSGLVTFR